MILLGIIGFSGIAQDTTSNTDFGKNELRVNAFYTLFGLPEISYERILSNKTSFGLSLSIPLAYGNGYDAIINPYYRLYFGNKKAAGFFIEGVGSIVYDKHYIDEEFSLGLGLSFGGKFLNKKGWIGEINIGLIGHIINAHFNEQAYPRMGITFGKRF